MPNLELSRIQDNVDSLQAESAKNERALAVHEAICAERYEHLNAWMRRMTLVVGALFLLEFVKFTFPDVLKTLIPLILR